MNKILYLTYRRVRPGFGVPFASILMYGAFNGGLTWSIFIAALGFMLLEVFGGFYNDYWDYDDDIKNKRKDKFTTLGLLNKYQARNLSFLIAAIGLVFIWFTNIFVFVISLYYSILFILYSHPLTHLKGSVKGYMIATSMYLILPFTLNTLIGAETTLYGFMFGLFFFFQFTYILCQKDSTDKKDSTNLFMIHGWERYTKITALFGALSSLSLLLISFINPYFILIWALNAFVKFLNINSIRKKTITRKLRYRIVLTEFFTPFIYLIGVVIV